MKSLQLALACSLVLVAPACKKKAATKETPKAVPDAGGGKPVEPADAGGAAAAEPTELKGFDVPESVLYDGEADVYLVSNIAGDPTAKDDNGYISRVKADGTIEALKWIDPTKEGVTLNAPKGTAILGEILFVADIDVVRMFDRKTGEPKGELAIEGATFLNDLSVIDGVLWLSDTGIKFGASGPEPTHTDAIYRISPETKEIKKVISGDELGHPNGVAGISDTEVRVVTFGTGEVYKVTLDGETGKRDEIVKLPKGQLDGVVEMPDSSLLVSSWEAKAVYRVDEDGQTTELITGVESPADIGFDSRHRKLLIPLFLGNVVKIHTIE